MNLSPDCRAPSHKHFMLPNVSHAQVVTYDHFYAWLEDILLPNLRADVWYNGDQPIGQRGFVGDRNGRIMGYAIMRQLRIKKG